MGASPVRWYCIRIMLWAVVQSQCSPSHCILLYCNQLRLHSGWLFYLQHMFASCVNCILLNSIEVLAYQSPSNCNFECYRWVDRSSGPIGKLLISFCSLHSYLFCGDCQNHEYHLQTTSIGRVLQQPFYDNNFMLSYMNVFACSFFVVWDYWSAVCLRNIAAMFN